jgi:SAM-dependent methyltransferase
VQGPARQKIDLDAPSPQRHCPATAFAGTFRTAPLVLDYVADLHSAFLEFRRVLKPGGALVFSVQHPMDTMRLYGGRYHETELVGMEWKYFGEPRPYIAMYRCVRFATVVTFRPAILATKKVPPLLSLVSRQLDNASFPGAQT